ncbi:hypothetical protein CHU95_08385 [Niveispirillum lacus]|uniref:Uncharacterized protein n=1 Tax=Niveispirillum lacus TaxID=1981099 RepID=A0A255Z190_9PROT|nr:hypothetical protein [Niveispirillum lacus]OYQ35238.1 hypothetical protein CHU95_08385 [Niveispirillum lacus]
MSRGGVLMITCLLAMLLAAAVGGVMAWNAMGGGGPNQAISLHGFIALGLGVLGSLVVGGGLMALVFFSNRSGHDQAVHEEATRRLPPDQEHH